LLVERFVLTLINEDYYYYLILSKFFTVRVVSIILRKETFVFDCVKECNVASVKLFTSFSHGRHDNC